MQVNEYTRILSIFGSDHDFRIIAQGIMKLLTNQMRAENTTLPRSIRSIRFKEEVLILFWRTITIS